MTTKFKVLKYDCASCAMVIEGIMEDTPGVKRAEVRASKRQLVVEHEDTVRPEQLKQSLDAEGYPVEVQTETD